MASKFAPPMQAPSVPPSTMKSAGMLMIAATLEPSMVAPSAIERPPTMTPMRPETFMSATLPGLGAARPAPPRGRGAGGRARGRADERQAVHALGRVAPRRGGLEHARAPAADGRDDL